MVKKSLVALALANALLASGPAMAATVVVNVTYDLTGEIDPSFGVSIEAPMLPVTLNEGDVLDLNLDFAGDQTLIIDEYFGALQVWLYSPFLGEVDPTQFTSTGQLSFTNSIGPLLNPTVTETFASETTHFGHNFQSADLTSALGRVEFSGLRLVAHVDDFADGNPHSWRGTFFYVGGYELSIGTLQTAVPEPSTWTMMLLGFGAAGMALRRRKRASTIRIA